MTAPNHALGSIAVVGIFGSIGGLNIFSSPWYSVVVVLASLLPDIDHPRSIYGKMFYPISKPLNRRFGHRTITHSLIFLVCITAVFSLFQNLFELPRTYTYLFFLSYLSHLIFDMMTIQGVPLFYPFFRNPCVLPGKPEYRLNTNNLRSETSVFCFFLLSIVFLQPLFDRGFWTSYNRLFGTMQHLVREFNSSTDLLTVDVQYRRGSAEFQQSGYLIHASSSTLVLHDTAFHIIGEDPTEHIIKAIPEHTSIPFTYRTISLYQVSADSISALPQHRAITALELTGTHPFTYTLNGRSGSSSRSLKTDYISSLHLSPTISKDIPKFYSDTRIQTYEKQIDFMRQLQIDEIQRYESELSYLDTLKAQAIGTADLQKKERLINAIAAYSPTPAKDYTKELLNLELMLNQLLRSDEIRYEKHLAEHKPESAHFSGFYTYISYEP